MSVNYYIECPVPPQTDPAWADTVGGWEDSRRRLDESRVILKYPIGVQPTQAEADRLGGVIYDSTTITALLAGPEYVRNNSATRIFPFLRPHLHYADLTRINWDDWRTTMLGPVERIDTYGTGMAAGDIIARDVYGPGQTEVLPTTGQRVPMAGALPFATEMISWGPEGLVGPMARAIVGSLLNNDGTEAHGYSVVTVFDLDEAKGRGAARRRRVWDEIEVHDIATAIGGDPTAESSKLLNADGQFAKERFLTAGDSAAVLAHIDEAMTWTGANALPWLTQSVRDSIAARLVRWP